MFIGKYVELKLISLVIFLNCFTKLIQGYNNKTPETNNFNCEKKSYININIYELFTLIYEHLLFF